MSIELSTTIIHNGSDPLANADVICHEDGLRIEMDWVSAEEFTSLQGGIRIDLRNSLSLTIPWEIAEKIVGEHILRDKIIPQLEEDPS